MHRSSAHLVTALSAVLGGGSLILFGAFLVMGPFTVFRFDASEPQVLIWDGFLSLMFFLQHSAMVREPFRSRLLGAVPGDFHAAAYAIVSGAVLVAVVLLWQTSQTVLFQVHGPLQWLAHAVALLAIAGFTWSVWALESFDPFGRGPIVARLRGTRRRPPAFVLRGPYLWVRHPLYFFTLVLIWSAPGATSDRLLFDVLWTLWIVVGSFLEERDLCAEFGENYRRYQRIVPMLLPWRGPVGSRLTAS